MNTTNTKLKMGILSLTKEQINPLAQAVRDAADSIGSGIRKREHLFFQVEPFAREYDEYYYRDPKDRQDSYGYSVNYCLNAVQKRGTEKYRASLFAWLSYYHPDKADAFCDSAGVTISGYIGDPAREGCNAGAREWFRQREVAHTDVHGFVEENDAEPIIIPTTQSEVEPKKEAEVIPNQPTEQKNWKPYVIAAVVIGAIALASLGYFGADSFPVLRTGTEVPDQQIAGAEAAEDNPKQPAEENGTEEKEEGTDVPEEPPVIQKTTEEKPTPAPTRAPVNPIWDNISDSDWSKRTLEYFYPFVTRSNRTDLLDAASRGNSDAQTLVGIGYHRGLLGKVDHGLELRQYLEPACRSGHGRACTLIGVHYRRGWGYPINNVMAASYYSKGCKLGNLAGCNYEAVRYGAGQGVPQDVDRAVATHQKNCDAGMGYSCINLAEAYIFGRGVQQNIPRARELWSKGQQLILPSKYPDFDQVYTIKK